MHMTFWWDSRIDNFFFKGLNIPSTVSLIILCLVVVAFSFFLECLRYLQTKQRQCILVAFAKQINLTTSEDATLIPNDVESIMLNVPLCSRVLRMSTDVTLWVLLRALGYMVMLVAMTYNGWLFVACILGGGIGYFVFGLSIMSMQMRNREITKSIRSIVKQEDANKDPESTERPSTSSGRTKEVAECDLDTSGESN